ncbi:MAG: head-tail connector protein [Peptococcaceae bacterium MAG4]|nr:head-tail connector protein [Peptococcaceae bacterium MAG4]
MIFDLNTVKEHLRITHHLEDVLLMAYMAAAQDWAESFLGKPLADFETLPGTVLAGLLLHTALLYESREGEFVEKNLQAIRLLYYPYRQVNV